MKKGLSSILVFVLILTLLPLSVSADNVPGLTYNTGNRLRLDKDGKGQLVIEVPAADNVYYSAVSVDLLFEGTILDAKYSKSGGTLSTQGPLQPGGSNADPNHWYVTVMDTSAKNTINGDLAITLDIEYKGSSPTTLTITNITRHTVAGGSTNGIYNDTPTDINIQPYDNTSMLYAIDTDVSIANGSITSSHATAAEGTSIAITASPSTGYTISSWVVRQGDSTGASVPFTVSSELGIVFTMPASAVYVSAVFRTVTSSPGDGGGGGGGGGGDTTNNEKTPPLSEVELIDSENPLSEYPDPVDFTDVTDDHWAYEYVEYLARRGYITGRSADIFAPNDPITRAEFITILARMSGDELPAYEGTFEDVAADAYYARTVAWGVSKGVTIGTSETTFEPNRQISRQEIATMIMRYINAADFELPKTLEKASFSDEELISEYAVEAVTAMQRAEIINGYPDGTFAPRGSATRAEAAKMLALVHYAMNS